MTTLFNSITVCENQEDFDAIKEEIKFPCVVVIWDNNENITINKDMSWFVWDEYIIRWRTENKKFIRCEIR